MSDPSPAPPRPNILFVMTDQQRFDTVGANGNPLVATPHLDRLAAEGMRFTQAYTCLPICAPVRGSLLTGTYPHKHGILSNYTFSRAHPHYRLREDETTFPPILADHGYRLGYMGKWHVGDVLCAADYGFEGWSLPGYGNVRGSDAYRRHLAELGVARPEPVFEHYMLGSEAASPNEASGRSPGPPAAHPIGFVGKGARDLLGELARSTRETGQPFYLGVHFWEPHAPYLPSEPFASAADPSAIPPWGNFADDLAGKPECLRRYRDLVYTKAAALSWPEWQRVVARYWGVVSQLDAELGLLLDALEAEGLADNTVVVFTTDHGDTVGCHGGCFDKGVTMVEELVHIPLIVRWPAHVPAGAVCEAFVSNVDHMPTVLDLAGAPAPDGVDGRSLRPLLSGTVPTDWREAVAIEFHGLRFAESKRALRWRQYKYVMNFASIEELYDLEADPWELHNLAVGGEADDVVRRMRRLLLEHMHVTDDRLGHAWELLLK